LFLFVLSTKSAEIFPPFIHIFRLRARENSFCPGEEPMSSVPGVPFATPAQFTPRLPMSALQPQTDALPAIKPTGSTLISADASQGLGLNASLSLGGVGGGDQLGQALSLILAIIQTIAAGINGGGTAGAVPPPGAAGLSALAVAGPTLENTSPAGEDSDALDESLALIAQDPDGAKLLAEAKARGVTIEVGNPATAGGQFDVAVPCAACQAAADASGVAPGHVNAAHDGDDGGLGIGNNDDNVIVNGVTLSNSQTGKIHIVVRDPSNIKTIVHELVHAVSTQDGNSKQEEGIADAIGSRVASRTGGAAVGALAGSERQIFLNKQEFYPDLNANNDIRATIRALGINIAV
jgi:catechol 2,3-dioxygenase-like lactoylglutathione lyase family enzyme